MKLTSYMDDQKISPEAMAVLIGNASASGVIKWMRGDRVPRPDQQRRIAEVTDGLVMPNDFILASALATPTPAKAGEGQAA